LSGFELPDSNSSLTKELRSHNNYIIDTIHTEVPQNIEIQPKTYLHLAQLLSVGIVMLLLGLGGGYILFSNKANTHQPSTQVTPSNSAQAVYPSTAITPTGNQNVQWKTYANEKYGYSINYPPKWTAGDGWFTAPGGQPGYGYSDVSIQVLPKTTNLDNSNREKDSLAEYVKKDAGFETGPSRTPLNITEIVTQSGLTGYKVEWEASSWSAGKKTYTTFFENPKDKTSTIQIAGIEGKHMDIYDSMIDTFSITK
jgi:hypothetical protein